MIKNKKNKIDDCALVVLSCKEYSEVALLTINKLSNQNVHKYFDCYYSISDMSFSNQINFKPLLVFNYSTWSEDLIKIIDQINQKYIFIWIDDLFPLGKINWELIKVIFEDFRKLEGNYLRLNPYPKGDIATNNNKLNKISKNASYRASTVFSIWDKNILKKLLLKSENAWQFEIFGSIRSSTFDGFYSSNIYLVKYLNLVIKGQIRPSAEKIINQEGFSTEAIKLKRMNMLKSFFWIIQSRTRVLFGKIPYSIQNYIRKIRYKNIPK